MLKEFKAFIEEQDLFKKDEKILLAVSGGVDSVVMAALFHQAGFRFGLAHCNFSLRAEESDQDEMFVEHLAEKYNVAMHSITFDTSAYAKKNKLSVQLAARELRYSWFKEICEQFVYRYICTAHHSDDSTETFLINLVRGTSISGLHGILPKNNKIIRPLLFAGKKEITDFAKKNKLKFRHDSSNDSDKYMRNKIRNRIIPLMKELNPSLDETIKKNISHLQDVEKIYEREIERVRKLVVKAEKKNVVLPVAKLQKLDPLHTYLYELLKPYGFNSSDCADIIATLGGISGKEFLSPTHRLLRDRGNLVISARHAASHKKTEMHISAQQKKLELDEKTLCFKKLSQKQFRSLKPSEENACLDLDKLNFPLVLRTWNKGDFFYPSGMKGKKKKLSDFFTDRKLSLRDKEDTWLLCSGDDIIWILGMRVDERYKATADSGKIYFAELC